MNSENTLPNTGIVKWFDCRRGFGFILAHDGHDIFVHFSAIEGQGFRKLTEGERVEYEAITRPNGQFATRVRRVPT